MGVWSFLLYPNHSRTIQLLFHFCWSSDDMLSFSHVSSVHSPIPGSWVIRSRSSWSEAFAKMSSLSEEKSTEAPSESARKFGMFQRNVKLLHKQICSLKNSFSTSVWPLQRLGCQTCRPGIFPRSSECIGSLLQFVESIDSNHAHCISFWSISLPHSQLRHPKCSLGLLMFASPFVAHASKIASSCFRYESFATSRILKWHCLWKQRHRNQE